jgi:hypothetical protein
MLPLFVTVPGAPVVKIPAPTDPPPPIGPDAAMGPLFEMVPPPRTAIPVLPVINPLELTFPAPVNDTPLPLDEVSVPLLITVHLVPDAPSMASLPEAVEVTVPVLVM